jgi:hypothetical protein
MPEPLQFFQTSVFLDAGGLNPARLSQTAKGYQDSNMDIEVSLDASILHTGLQENESCVY